MNYAPIKIPVLSNPRTGDVWLHVADCPYCGSEHTHGAGTGSAPGLYGQRTPHCGGHFDRWGRCLSVPLRTPDYELLPSDSDCDWIAERARAKDIVRPQVEQFLTEGPGTRLRPSHRAAIRRYYGIEG